MEYFGETVSRDLEEIAREDLPWEVLDGKTVLITGAGGMIASYFACTLLYLNDTRGLSARVKGLVRSRERAEKRFGKLLRRDDFSLIEGDVRSLPEIDGPADYIISAASPASPRSFTDDPVGTARANAEGTANCLELAVYKKSAGFLLLSTREIYGAASPDIEYAGESDYGALDPTLVRSCYPEGKRMAETYCAAYASQYGVPARVARIAHTYGPGIALGDGRVVGDFLRDVIAGRDITLNSAGTAVLSLTYLSDLVAGLWRALLLGDGFAYNISTMESGCILTVRELAERLAALFPEKHISARFRETPPGETAGYLRHKVPLLDSGAMYALGWRPKVSVEEGFRRVVGYYETMEAEKCPL